MERSPKNIQQGELWLHATARHCEPTSSIEVFTAAGLGVLRSISVIIGQCSANAWQLGPLRAWHVAIREVQRIDAWVARKIRKTLANTSFRVHNLHSKVPYYKFWFWSELMWTHVGFQVDTPWKPKKNNGIGTTTNPGLACDWSLGIPG